MAAAVANAAGLDRSGQSIGVLFEQGRYGELSFGAVSPSVSGVAGPLLGQGAGFESGSVSPNFANFGAAYKADLNDTLSYALIYDQPFGAAVDYTNASPFYFANAAVAGRVFVPGADRRVAIQLAIQRQRVRRPAPARS